MSFIYILKSINTGKYYIGCTDDVNRRFAEHNNGEVFSTKPLKPFKLMLKQEYSTLSLARRIEQKLKKYKSRKIIEVIIKDGYIEMDA